MNNHTLVIPTYNRPAMLKRLVRYYERRAPEMNLLVLDSSRLETAAQNAQTLAFYGERLRHETFPETTPPAMKLRDGLERVQTRYVSFCADDDIVFPDALPNAIAFLEGHPEYVSAHGRYLNFQERRFDNIRVWLEYGGPGNEAGHPGARIFRLLQRYESLFYGLFRTPDLRQIFEGVARQPSLHYQELFQSVAALIKGKVHRFQQIYAARQSGPAAEPEREKWQTYYWFAENSSEFVQHYLAYRDTLWDFYRVHGARPQLDQAAFFKAMDISHAVYFSAQCPPAYFHSVLQKYWPDDPYGEPNEDDVTARILYRVARMEQAIRKVIGYLSRPRLAMIRSLDEQVSVICNRRFKCRLPWNARLLAHDQYFHIGYIEVCRYLDEP
jgi:glycosyltransferase domain-containing protein